MELLDLTCMWLEELLLSEEPGHISMALTFLSGDNRLGVQHSSH